MTAVLELQHVGLEYKVRHGLFNVFRHSALNDVSFSVERGETFGVLGRNGSGKSTLLKILAGLIRPTHGSITLPSGEITRSLLTLGLGFRMDLSGADNVLLSLALQGYSRKEARALIPEIEAFAELGKFFHEPVRTYSSGMRARLGFATGTCSNVDLLLIDEVLSVGDLQFREKAEATMMERMTGEQTVVFVTQAPPQVKKLCDRAVWLDGGEIAAIGQTEDVANSYVQAVGAKQPAATATKSAGAEKSTPE